MTKAQITLPNGTVIRFEGSTADLADVLERLGMKPTLAPASAPPASPRRAKEQPDRRLDLSDYIANLIDGGFFRKPQDLGAVKVALAEMGHHYPVTTLSPALLRQVRKRNLRRIKQDKRWMYTG